jgi:toxin YoeB
MKTHIDHVSFHRPAFTEYQQWAQEDPQVFAKINSLITEVIRDPFRGTGKPEPLKYDFAGHWSRRINGEHRLVYKVSGSQLTIISCKFHYE